MQGLRHCQVTVLGPLSQLDPKFIYSKKDSHSDHLVAAQILCPSWSGVEENSLECPRGSTVGLQREGDLVPASNCRWYPRAGSRWGVPGQASGGAELGTGHEGEEGCTSQRGWKQRGESSPAWGLVGLQPRQF